MRLLNLFLVLSVVGCVSSQKDGYARFQEASQAGVACGKLLKKLPVQKETITWSVAQQQSVEFAYNTCLTGYKDLASHASSLEFMKTVLQQLDIPFREISEKGSVSLVGSLEGFIDKETVLMVHATDMNNAQMIHQGDQVKSLWGQTSMSTRALGVLQMMALAFAQKSTEDVHKYNLALAVTEHGQWRGVVKDFSKINLVLNEGGHAFTKQNKNMFLIGSEQKGGAWLRVRHKSPHRLLSHLDSLLAVFMPHEPRDFSGPSKCQVVSFVTAEEKINVIPQRVDVTLSCTGAKALNLGQAFSHPHASIQGRAEGSLYTFTIEVVHPEENKYGQISALQLAAQGLQKLSIIPFRDWSFEEPKFYGHQRTPASIDFVKKAKNIYPQQSDWGGLLWELDEAGEWSAVASEITPDKKDGPEKLFRTTCSWTGFRADQDGAEALVDCRLARSGARARTAEDQDASEFVRALQSRAKDPSLKIEMVKGWNSITSESSHRFVKFAREQIKKIYPSSETTTWMSPGATLVYSDKNQIPTYGFNPILRDDILEMSEKSISADQIFTANQIYSGAVSQVINH